MKFLLLNVLFIVCYFGAVLSGIYGFFLSEHSTWKGSLLYAATMTLALGAWYCFGELRSRFKPATPVSDLEKHGTLIVFIPPEKLIEDNPDLKSIRTQIGKACSDLHKGVKTPEEIMSELNLPSYCVLEYIKPQTAR